MTARNEVASRIGPDVALLSLEDLVAELSSGLVDIGTPAGEPKIHHAFERLLRLFSLDRIALWEFSPERSEFVLLHFRRTPGAALPPRQQHADATSWATERLLRGEPVVVHDVRDLPPAAQRLRRYLERQRVRSHLSLPLRSEGKVFGALVFSAVRREVYWDPDTIGKLQVIADILGTALAAQHARRARRHTEALEISILNSLPSRIAVLDRQGEILSVNKAWREFCSCSGNCQEGMRVGAEYLAAFPAGPGGCPIANHAGAGIRDVLAGKRDRFEFEYRCQSGAGRRWFHLTAVPLAVDEGGAVVVHADVSDRRWAELELSDSDDRWRKFADQLPVLMWLREPNTDKIHVNRFGLEMTGWPVEDFTLAKWIAAIHPADLKRELPRFRAAQATREKYMFEYRYRHASGEYRWVLDCGVPRFQRDGTFLGYGGILIDIQARKQAERERTDLAGRLLRAQEAERSRIARELHDDIAQRIALLAICMENLEENGAGNGNGGDSALRQLRRDAKQLSLDVSHLSHQLHSSYLEHLGLAAAVEHQCKELAAVHGVRIDCRIDALRRPFEHDVALSLFRVLQEALRNALRHADPTRITVELHADRRAVRLCVVDDGVGFDPRAVDGEGLGLASMRERLRLLGGEIAIVSKHRGGTRVEATVPHAHQKFAPARAGDRHAASRTS